MVIRVMEFLYYDIQINKKTPKPSPPPLVKNCQFDLHDRSQGGSERSIREQYPQKLNAIKSEAHLLVRY